MISSETTLLAQGNTVPPFLWILDQLLAAAPLSELDVLEKAESAFRKPGLHLFQNWGYKFDIFQ